MERVSALMDGELEATEANDQLERMKEDPELRSAWDTYHVIGDVLRGHGVVSRGFVQRVAARIEREPPVLAARRFDRRFALHIALPLAASVCAVAVVGWLALYDPSQGPRAPLAQNQQAPATVQSMPDPAARMVPAAVAVNEYLLAHQQFSPRTALQGVASYMLTVSAQGVENE
ncbi:MAG TPA: sigma-E factor negative regulatory protein [Burkholderiales bacterium]|nr:sigma-E factor negative regulatory protein [Burkholderiales bacterium]